MLCSVIKPKDPVDTTYLGPPVWDQMDLPRYLIERVSSKINYDNISEEIISGFILGVVRGRSEHGPRALGNRSIICDATNPRMKDYINKEVKNRESFRPFSPVVRYEDVNEYFEWYKESRWMTFCPRVREEYKELLSSVTHVDGTARVQTVTKEQNEFLYNLLTQIHKKKGHAVLLNTSFNIAGKPILNSYRDAFWMLDNKNISGIILEDYYFPKVTERL
jgi:carbamoyltransferase